MFGGMVVQQRKLTLPPERLACVSAMVCGVVAHIFGLVNILHNYDNILQQPNGYGAGISLGRWLLSLLGDFFQNVLGLGYNLPVVNGLVFLILVALSSALLVSVLGIRNHTSAVLTGCLMATFPTACATMVFRYAAPYYGVSLLLSVLAVWVLDKSKWGVVFSILCITCSMGIYQAYAPFTIALFVLVLMREALEEDAQLKDLIQKGVRCCFCLLLGVVLYFAMLKLCLHWYPAAGETALDSYQGVASMGQITLPQLPGLVIRAWKTAVFFSLNEYCILAYTPVLKILWTVLIVLILALALLLIVVRKPKPLNAAFFCLMGLLFPLAVNFIEVMVPDGIVYTLMVYSFVLIACAPLMLLEYLPEDKKKRGMAGILSVVTALIVFYNGYHTNMNYTSLHFANRHVENYFSGLMTQMRMTEGYGPEKTWAFLGDKIDDPKLYDIWNVQPVYGGVIGSTAKGLLNASYSVNVWIQAYMGYETVYASAEEEMALAADARVKEMPCWPRQGSIRVVDDYIVIKFQELAE